MYNNELYHHGIKGMKWGIRRFQNKDGSLTNAGRKRYSKEVEEARTALNGAKKKQKQARSEFNKAYNAYSMLPTNNNYQRYLKATGNLSTANKEFKAARLDYKVAKAESEGRFGSTSKKSKHRAMLEEKYRKQGYTDKQAAILADDRIKSEKIVVGVAALTVTACAAYAANKYIRDRTDQMIKSGDVLQRIEMQDTGGKLYDTFYASTGKHDNKRYEGMLGATRKMQTGQAYMMKLEAAGDIKVASKENAAKTFGELYKNDSEFRESVKTHVARHFGGKNKVDIDNLSDRNIRKMYENFNSGLINIRESGSGADKKFYDALKSKGYGAIQDINDMKYSGYNAKNPLIVFDNAKNNIMVKSFDSLKDEKLNGKFAIELGKSTLEGMSKTLLSPYSAVAATGAAASMYATDHTKGKKKF